MSRVDYIEQLSPPDRAILERAMTQLERVIKFSGDRQGNDRFWEVENALARYLLENQPDPAARRREPWAYQPREARE